MSQPSSNKSWRISLILFLCFAALLPALLVGWVNAKQNSASSAQSAPLAPDWYRAGSDRAPWEGTPLPRKPAAANASATSAQQSALADRDAAHAPAYDPNHDPNHNPGQSR